MQPPYHALKYYANHPDYEKSFKFKLSEWNLATSTTCILLLPANLIASHRCKKDFPRNNYFNNLRQKLSFAIAATMQLGILLLITNYDTYFALVAIATKFVLISRSVGGNQQPKTTTIFFICTQIFQFSHKLSLSSGFS